jgi:hypothetical protein
VSVRHICYPATYWTVSVVVVEWCVDPDVPVIVIAYLPAGVAPLPPLPLLLPPPPHAAWKITPANTRLYITRPSNFPFFARGEPKPTPRSVSPQTGSQTA